MTACELDDSIAWNALLTARTLLGQGARRLALVGDGQGWACVAADDPRAESAAAPVLRFGLDPEPDVPAGRPVPAALQAVARVYLPVLLGAAAARAAGRSFVVAHVTQTLDGRIACQNGHSQWIGNAADLRHAHRMRALCDGVMVGSATAIADDPQLTVRVVDGPAPRRIVLSGSGRVVQRGGSLRVFTGAGADIVVGEHAEVPQPPAPTHLVRVAPDGARLAPAAVLEALRARGWTSIYLEGGSVTLSSFLAAGCIDLLQIHVAPMVLGSGIPSFALPMIEHLDGATRFAMDHVSLDGHLLLTCRPQRP